MSLTVTQSTTACDERVLHIDVTNAGQAATGVLIDVQGVPLPIVANSCPGVASPDGDCTVDVPYDQTVGYTLTLAPDPNVPASAINAAVDVVLPPSVCECGGPPDAFCDDTSDNSASVTIDVEPQFDLAVSVSGGTAVAGGAPAHAKIGVTNSGCSNDGAVVATVTIDEGFTAVAIEREQAGDSCVQALAGPTAPWTCTLVFGNLPGNGRAVLRALLLTAPANSSLLPRSVHAVVNERATEIDNVNNEATGTVRIVAKSDVAVSWLEPIDVMVVEQRRLSSTVTVRNDGPSNAADVQVRIKFAAPLLASNVLVRALDTAALLVPCK